MVRNGLDLRPPGNDHEPGPGLTIGPEAVMIHTRILTISARVISVLILFCYNSA